MAACSSRDNAENSATGYANYNDHADSLEISLEKHIIDPWYPGIINNLYGGYISDLNFNWTLTESSQKKALVQQARHIRATSFLQDFYPGREDLREYPAHGFRFLRDHMWDKDFGGFHTFCTKEGTPDEQSINDKRIYGQSFAVCGMSQYYSTSKDKEALAGLYRIWPDSLVRLRLEEMFFLIRDTFVHHDGYLQLYFFPDWKLVPDET